jgi:hypothetical protein
MEYMVVRIKIPKPIRGWSRFRIRTLLTLMLIVGLGSSWWRTRWNSELANARRQRDAAIRNWRQVVGRGASREAQTRVRYSHARAALETAKKRAQQGY